MNRTSPNGNVRDSDIKPVHGAPPFLGRTLAYRRYRESVWRTEELLKAGLSGLSGRLEPIERVLAKMDSFKGSPGPIPKGYAPEIEVKRTSTSQIELKMDDWTATIFRKVIKEQRAHQSRLRFHLYSILIVSIWASFETYLTMLFEELYAIRPQLLKSNEILTFRDAVDHEENLRSFLIHQQLEKIEHFTFLEMLKYLDDRINFRLDAKRKAQFEIFYFVRNIVAHRTGIVRPNQVKLLPNNTSVRNNELRLTKQFLEEMLVAIDGIITRIEKHVIRKFYRSHASA